MEIMQKTKVATWIERRGLKQKWICEKIGISETYLSLICSGDRQPSNDIMIRLSEVLSISVSELM